jgi:PAS domain S-box-containing protein
METEETPIQILHLEDSKSDSLLVQINLRKENLNFEYFFVDNEQDFLEHLENRKIDIILSDYNLPDYNGAEALIVSKTRFSHIPFVFVSGTMGEEAAIESLLNGATDYVLKNRIERLGSAVKRAIRESKLQQEYQNAISRLRQKEEQYRTLIEGMNEGLMLTDTQDTILFVNQQTCDITGYDADELIHKNCHQLLFDPNSEKFNHELDHLKKQGTKNSFELEMVRKNNEKIWVHVSCSPVYNDDDKEIGLIGVFQDISDRKKTENERQKLTQELVLAKEKAEESDRLKSAFLANISHEIRTPMNGILGFAELLKTPELTQDMHERYIHIIEQSGKRMLNIINDIVDISKIEAGQMNIHLEETNVDQLLKDLLVFFTPEAHSKGLKLTVSDNLPGTKCMIQTDYTKLAQILTNLIKNAIKFTNSGSIEFGYDPKVVGTLHATSLHGTSLQFFVKDTGAGIPADQTEMIFERFRQGSVLLTRAYEGAGLGLSISKAFVDMLGGKIWVESEPGKGSTFFFSLPLINTKIASEETIKTQSDKRDPKRYCLLVAEDDENSMLYMRALLESEQITVLEANTGKIAVDRVKQHPEINLVLMDLKMPEMDGFEATRQIKRLRPELPVIAQTAYSFAEEKEKALLAGCDDYISKPIKKLALIEKIQYLLTDRNLRHP